MRSAILLTALCLLALPARAADQSCTVDADCPDGQVCLATPCAVPPMECAEGQECPEMPPCETAGVCTVPPWDGRCAADADCPAGFACIEVEIPCASGGCAPCTCACESGKECPPCECPPCPEPPECTPVFEKYCQFQPKTCAADADCGAGWKCVAEEACSGGSACACPDCGPDMECPPCDCPPPEEPACEVVGYWCAVAETPCAADGDCPGGFTCAARLSGGDCACPDCACDPDAGAPCDCGPCDCPAPVEERVCLPAGWADTGYGVDTALPEPGSVAGDGEEKGTPVSDYAAPPTAPGGGGQATNDATDAGDDSGCAATGRPSRPLSLALLLFVGLLPFARRRALR